MMKLHIPANPQLRAEQVASWAFQAADWSNNSKRSTIEGHYSANALLEAVAEEEKPALRAAWAEGYKQGKDR